MTGLYVHVPFCARACPYCDFDFEVGRSPDAGPYLDGLAREVDAHAEVLGGAAPTTIYVGGGTPSVLEPHDLERLLSWIAGDFMTPRTEEYTLEANPEHVTPTLCGRLRDHGVGRLSLGVQTFSAAGLRELGRAHDPEQAAAAIDVARAHGLEVAVDLIVGWRGQTVEVVADDVERALGSGARHVSVYALTIEGAVPWQRLVRRGLRVVPDADAQAELLVAAEQRLVRRGFHHYEVSNYAHAGAEAVHNLGYWTWKDYVGLGPSACSARFAADGGVVRRSNRRGLARWLESPASAHVEELAPVDAAVEGLWTGLRRLDGIDVAAFVGRFPAIDRDWLRRRVQPQVVRGNLEWDQGGERLRVTPGRWLWHDSICAALM